MKIISEKTKGLTAGIKKAYDKCSDVTAGWVDAADRKTDKLSEKCMNACEKVSTSVTTASRSKKIKMILGASGAFLVIIAGVCVFLSETAPYAAYADGTVVEEPYSLMAGEEELFVLSSEENANKVIKQVKEHYRHDGSKIEECTLDPELTVVETELKRGEEPPVVTKVDDAVTLIINGTKETTYYTVKDGDTLWSISSDVGFSIKELEKMNPDMDAELIHAGDKIKTYKVNPLIDVSMTEVYTKDEVIKRKVKYVKDDSMYKGEKEVTEEGRDGVKSVTRRVTTKNGEVVKSKILKSSVKKEAKAQIVHKGTKERPVETADSGYTEKTYNGASYYTSYNASKGGAVADYACQFIGNPYVYGGSSLTGGTDCSGFVMSVYAKFGVSLPHSSYAQRGCGVAVSFNDLQPGDIICYSGHVAIYIGGGKVVHASTPETGIIISSVYHMSPICARRIFT